jgi:DNA-binding NarL/FixJ family response regulator
MVRVLIADDHPVFRFGLRTLLKADPMMEVVGEATNGEEAIREASLVSPDVILMDLNMPGINGIEATRCILTEHPQVHILVLTMFDDDDSVFAAMRAGARGYLLKGAEGNETLQAIRVTSTGEAIFSPAIASRMMQYFGAPHSPNAPQPFPELTDRE